MSTLEKRVQALENNRCYDDTDLKEKMGYDDIPTGSNIQAEIDALKNDRLSLEENITYTGIFQCIGSNVYFMAKISAEEYEEDKIKITLEDAVGAVVPSGDISIIITKDYILMDSNIIAIFAIYDSSSESLGEMGIVRILAESYYDIYLQQLTPTPNVPPEEGDK